MHTKRLHINGKVYNILKKEIPHMEKKQQAKSFLKNNERGPPDNKILQYYSN